MKQISFLYLFVFLFGNTGLQAQCICQGQGKRFERFVERGEYSQWDVIWQRRKAKVASNRNLKYNFQCQAQRALEQLVEDIETSFVIKNRDALESAVADYKLVMSAVQSVYPRFYQSFAAKDYYQYQVYAEYLMVVELYSSKSPNRRNLELSQQLCSALDNLIDKGYFAIVDSNLVQGKEVAEAYVYLLDRLGQIEAFLGEDLENAVTVSYAEKYNDMECLPEYISANIAFEKRQFIQALEHTTCGAPSTDSLSSVLLQRMVNSLIGYTDGPVNLLIQASAIVAIDSITEGLRNIGFNKLPCPDTLSLAGSDCSFNSVVDEQRGNIIRDLDERANSLYSGEYYKEAILTLKAALDIVRPRGSTLHRTLRAKYARWIENATRILDNRRDVLVIENQWVRAGGVINDIAAFNPAYPSEDKLKDVRVHKLYYNAEVSDSLDNWLEALRYIQDAYQVQTEIVCSSCRGLSLDEIGDFRSQIVEQLEHEIDELNQEDLKLDAAKGKVDEISSILPNYPAQIRKARLECIYYMKRGDRFYKVEDYSSAFDLYRSALTSCQQTSSCYECLAREQILAKIRETIEKLVWVTLQEAKVPYDNQDYISACELIKQAQVWVARHEDYQILNDHLYKYPETFQYLVNDACDRARKTVRIVFKQSSTRKFNSSASMELKRHIESKLRSALRNTDTGEYIDFVMSERSADFILEVDITNIQYRFELDQYPTVHNYCTYSKEWIPGTNCYVWKPLATEQVRKYEDSAYGSVDFLSNINQYSAGGDRVPESWDQQAWRADIDAKYLAYCNLCPVAFLNSKERSYFTNTRTGPGLEKLLVSPLKQKITQMAPNWARMIEEFMRR